MSYKEREQSDRNQLDSRERRLHQADKGTNPPSQYLKSVRKLFGLSDLLLMIASMMLIDTSISEGSGTHVRKSRSGSRSGRSRYIKHIKSKNKENIVHSHHLHWSPRRPEASEKLELHLNQPIKNSKLSQKKKSSSILYQKVWQIIPIKMFQERNYNLQYW